MRYLVELTCAVDLPAGQTIEHLAEAQLTEALCRGLRTQGVLAGPSPDHIGQRSVHLLDGAAPDIERKAKRLRRPSARK
jgi:hypothetical protein